MRKFKMKTPPKGPNPPAGPDITTDKVVRHSWEAATTNIAQLGFRGPAARDAKLIAALRANLGRVKEPALRERLATAVAAIESKAVRS